MHCALHAKHYTCRTILIVPSCSQLKCALTSPLALPRGTSPGGWREYPHSDIWRQPVLAFCIGLPSLAIVSKGVSHHVCNRIQWGGVRYTSFSSAAIGMVSNDPMASTLFVYFVSCAEAGCHWVGRLLLRGSWRVVVLTLSWRICHSKHSGGKWINVHHSTSAITRSVGRVGVSKNTYNT